MGKKARTEKELIVNSKISHVIPSDITSKHSFFVDACVSHVGRDSFNFEMKRTIELECENEKTLDDLIEGGINMMKEMYPEVKIKEV